MCTVTYLPLGNDNFILTSNRDETPLRKTIFPKEYIEDGVSLLYPKDELAGGTWIGVSDRNRLVCLLNGGFKKHVRDLPYKKSRGVLVKELLTKENVVDFINDYNFFKIEPFTIVLIDWSNGLHVYELIWDGITKHFIQLNQEPKIWSSSTLYTDDMKLLREKWFSGWLLHKKVFSEDEIIEFHKDETKGNPEISLKMKRAFVETVSTTCIKKENNSIQLIYKDYLKSNTTQKIVKELL